MRSRWTPLLDAGRRAHLDLIHALERPRAAQLALLRNVLASNARSGFGVEHGFDAVEADDVDLIYAYRTAVPIRDYAGLLPWIERIGGGEWNALTDEPAFAFEETGGTSSGRKLIPYSRSTLAGFRAAILAWLSDVAGAFPAITAGRPYFAISPATRPVREKPGHLPVGLASDAAYLGEELAPALGALLVGADLAQIADVDEWRLHTLTELVRARDLSLVSVWSPTFLTRLLDGIVQDGDRVSRAVRDGDDRAEPDPARARELADALAGGQLDVSRLWPSLVLVSAWADGSSAAYAGQLKDLIGHPASQVRFQPKGLLATEGAFTLPLNGWPYPVPALTSSFIEFEDEAGDLHLVDELSDGSTSQLIATTPGGFYRYRIGDIVRCEGHERGVPMLSFVGRVNGALDLVGEKLDEGFVADSLIRLHGPAVLVADLTRHGYLLVVDKSVRHRDPAGEIERALSRSPLYAQARRIGQLNPLHLTIVDRLLERYLSSRLARGDRLGDVKPPVTVASWKDAAEIWPELARDSSNHATFTADQSREAGE